MYIWHLEVCVIEHHSPGASGASGLWFLGQTQGAGFDQSGLVWSGLRGRKTLKVTQCRPSRDRPTSGLTQSLKNAFYRLR